MARLGLTAARSARRTTLYISLLLMALSVAATAGGSPRNVLVVKNSNSQISKNIAAYYAQVRRIPPENICTISCSTNEIVPKTDIDAFIVGPIRAFLTSLAVSHPESRIDYIVLTKGIPIGGSGYPNTFQPLALTSVLTSLSEPAIAPMTSNPYMSADLAFTHERTWGGYHLYLVTTLDGYGEADIRRMIEDSVAATRSGSVALDRSVTTDSSYNAVNNRITNANSILVNKGIPTIYDNTSTFLSGLSGLLGYFSWGSNDPFFSIPGNYYPGLALYRSNTFKPGSIADTAVSTSARTFVKHQQVPPEQLLIGDLIEQGVCGVAGYISEPRTSNVTFPNILFDRYTKGYNMAESFYAACPKLYWTTVIVGDPLMAPFAETFQVSVDSPGTPLTGTATISATASAPAGISKIEFYFDGKYVGAATQAPFSVTVDTTQHTVGPHLVEVWAREGSSVAVQKSATATVSVQNPISNLSKIPEAFQSVDGQGVRATAKLVVAGTSDMGGGEFYIQEENRSGGVRVLSTANVVEGDLVTVVGPLITESGEKSIIATNVICEDHLLTPVNPASGMSNRAIGGADLNAYTKGVTGGNGLRNIGTLIRTWGRVTCVGPQGENYFHITDGSLLFGASANGLKIKFAHPDICKPNPNSIVMVTGLSSCEEVSGQTTPVVKLRKPADVLVLRP